MRTTTTIDGGNDDDFLSGGEGNDQLFGQAGNDIVFGENGDDQLSGGDGFDNLTGEAGNDIIAGGNDDDILSGGEGKDSLDGGDGDDLLTGGSGADVLTGGAGADTFSFQSAAEGPDEITDFVSGSDLIQISAERLRRRPGRRRLGFAGLGIGPDGVECERPVPLRHRRRAPALGRRRNGERRRGAHRDAQQHPVAHDFGLRRDLAPRARRISSSDPSALSAHPDLVLGRQLDLLAIVARAGAVDDEEIALRRGRAGSGARRPCGSGRPGGPRRGTGGFWRRSKSPAGATATR